ncbi:hypothetical protein AAZX31_11G192200 [Glycine max]|uniref:Uncharacterized protein n=1 Tax=Glycine max TaxID=3847 RepID=K7LQZ4_SOYBN|nr:hypothetical protein JHK85_032252 [Glycine max]KAG4994856.1 hypothetical protein JHK86_031683 [Glycine max]KAG5124862.1 hypothetical protein JHK82_031599 [Glycine max]KAG5146280.1 hypothetical protein JHK84_031823 [Glycine max]KAH1159756.1 hypothetical protein GYH30_031475 [Glycine max]
MRRSLHGDLRSLPQAPSCLYSRPTMIASAFHLLLPAASVVQVIVLYHARGPLYLLQALNSWYPRGGGS